MTIDRKALQAVAELTDEAGVLSLYATLDPRAESAARPAWQVCIRNELVALDRRLRRGGDLEVSALLRARLVGLERELDELLAAATAGLGRALFVPLSGGAARFVSVQVPLGNVVVLAGSAYVRPLVAAWCASPPTGIVAVSGHGARLVDLRLGHAEDAGTLAYEPADTDRRDLTGPAGGGPARAQHSAPQHDLYARRAAEHLARFLHGTGPRIAARASELEWEYVVLTGDPAEVAAVGDGLPHSRDVETVTAAHRVAALPAARVATAVASELTAARHAHGQRLAHQARDAALGGGAGAYGLADTLTTLAEGRVAHLLLGAAAEWVGLRGPDGRLYPHGVAVPGVAERELSTEPRLGEQLIAAVIRQGGDVTLLEPADATALADADGVAAILRW